MSESPKATQLHPLRENTVRRLINEAALEQAVPGRPPTELIDEAGLAVHALRCKARHPETGLERQALVVRLVPESEAAKQAFVMAGLIRTNAAAEVTYFLDPGEEVRSALLEAAHRAYLVADNVLQAARQ